MELIAFLFQPDVICLLAIAGAGGLWYRYHKSNVASDDPPVVYANMPPPRLYATVKKAINGFRLLEHSFKIVECDPTILTIRAACEWRDRTAAASPIASPQGYAFSQIILDIRIGLERESGRTFLKMNWFIFDGPFRSKANLIRATLSRSIFDALAAAGQTQHIQKD